MNPAPLVFMGSSEVSLEILRMLRTMPAVDVRGVVTPPDRPRRRGAHREPCDIKRWALNAGIEVASPENVNEPDALDRIGSWSPQVIVVAAYGQFLGSRLLEMPPNGCLNVHLSLLPELRGAAPAPWAILRGYTQTGVTVMRMNAGMDSGDILAQERLALAPSDTGRSLNARLAGLGAGLLRHTLPAWLDGRIEPRPQDPARATFAPRLRKSDGWIDWRAPAVELERRVRAWIPWPVCHTTLASGGGHCPTRLQVCAADVAETHSESAAPPGTVRRLDPLGPCVQTGAGLLRLRQVVPAGRRPMPGMAFMNGYRIEPGRQLGDGI